MAKPYIPAKDALFANFSANFASLIDDDPSTYGLVPGDAAVIVAADASFQTAYTSSQDPGTRTKASVATKDAQRAATEAVYRPYAILIRNNAGVSNEDKTALGLNIPDVTPTPVPPPVTAPVLALLFATPLAHQLNFRDAVSPLLKRKPVGVIGIQLFRAVGTVAATDPAQAVLYAVATKTPFVVDFDGSDKGKHCTYFGRWTTRSGAGGLAYTGPWSAPLDVIVI